MDLTNPDPPEARKKKKSDVITGEAVDIPVVNVPAFKAPWPATVSTDLRGRIERLMKHPRHENIAFSPTDRCFRVNLSGRGDGQRYTGLTKVLALHYWPEFDIDVARKNAVKSPKWNAIQRQRRKAAKDTDWTERKAFLANKGKSGMELGTLVHEQLCDYVNMPFVKFRTKYAAGVNAYTAKVAIFLSEKHLRPITAEMPIWDEKCGVATAIDMICVHGGTGRIIVVELKTSYQGYFTRMTGVKMRHPLAHFDSRPLNQASLQALMAKLILKHRYGIQGLVSGVIHVHRDGVQLYGIPPTWTCAENDIYASMIINRAAKWDASTERPRCRSAGGQGRGRPVARKRGRPRGRGRPIRSRTYTGQRVRRTGL